MKEKNELIKCTVPFCCGGVATYGLEEHGFTVAVANEIDFDRARWHKATHPDAEMILGDISGPEIKQQIIDAHIANGCRAGFFSCPCQPFSLQGGINLDDPRAYLFLDTLDINDATDMDIIVYENVPFWISDDAILSDDTRCIRQRIIDALKNEYHVYYGIQNGCQFGSCQLRKRSFIIAIKKELGTWELPEPLTSVENAPTFREICGHLESLKPGQRGKNIMHYAKKLPKWQDDFLNQLPPEKSGWDDDVLIKPKNKSGSDSQAKHPTSFTRLLWDKPINALTTDNRTIGGHRTIHPTDNRVLSPLELILCCGLPESYPVPRFAIGDEKLIYDVFGECFLPKHLAAILNNIKYNK